MACIIATFLSLMVLGRALGRGQVFDYAICLDFGPAVGRIGQDLGEHEDVHGAILSLHAESTLVNARCSSCQLVTVLPLRPLVMYLSSLCMSILGKVIA